MPRHKKGTLVRVLTPEEAGEGMWAKNSTEEYVEKYGWLHTVVRFLPREHGDSIFDCDAYECKSLDTGDLVQLFPDEITTKPMKEQTT